MKCMIPPDECAAKGRQAASLANKIDAIRPRSTDLIDTAPQNKGIS